jgi:hypothetical protein
MGPGFTKQGAKYSYGAQAHEASASIVIMGDYSDIGAIKAFPHLPDHLAALLVGVVSH